MFFRNPNSHRQVRRSIPSTFSHLTSATEGLSHLQDPQDSMSLPKRLESWIVAGLVIGVHMIRCGIEWMVVLLELGMVLTFGVCERGYDPV